MTFLEKLALCWRIMKHKESGLLDHAKREQVHTEDEMDLMMNNCIYELLTVFATQGHSGFSASIAQSRLSKLLQFEPLRPLTGEDSEWCEIEPGRYQNKRYSRVFKTDDGEAYDIKGKVFRDKDGGYFTSRESRVDVTFPYTPTTVYVDTGE